MDGEPWLRPTLIGPHSASLWMFPLGSRAVLWSEQWGKGHLLDRTLLSRILKPPFPNVSRASIYFYFLFLQSLAEIVILFFRHTLLAKQAQTYSCVSLCLLTLPWDSFGNQWSTLQSLSEGYLSVLETHLSSLWLGLRLTN